MYNAVMVSIQCHTCCQSWLLIGVEQHLSPLVRSLERLIVLRVLVSAETVLTAEAFAAVGVVAHIRVEGRVHLLVLDQVVLANEAFAALRPIACKPPPGMYVLVCVQMGFLSEPFTAVLELTDIWLLVITTTALTERLVSARLAFPFATSGRRRGVRCRR